MREDRVDDVFRLTILAGDIGADGRMRPLDLVVDGLADIVEQAAALREHDITAELGCHDAGEVRDLDGMIEHVLAVARAVAQAAEQSDELRMESVDTRLECRLFASFLDALVDFALRLLDHLLDARRMDAAILDELLECDARDLTAHRVEARQDDGLRRVVDDEVDARQRLERADVAALAADDAALHLVVRQRDDRDRRLRDVVSRAALDGRRENLAGLLVRLIFRLLLVLLDFHGFLMLELFLCLSHEDGLRLVGRETGDALKLSLLLGMYLVDGLLRLVDARLLACELLLLLLDGLELAVKVLLLLHDASLLA